MKLKKLFKIIKHFHSINIYNVNCGVLIGDGSNLYLIRDMPALYDIAEFGTVFEIDREELSKYNVRIDDSTGLERDFLSINRGIPLEKGGTFSFGGLRCVLFKKAEQRQLTLEGCGNDAENDFSGYIAIEPDMLSPISDGIISFEYIRFLGVGCVCAFENGAPVAVIRPREIEPESIEHLRTLAEGLSQYYK